jgi:hypothetical protein
MPEATIRMKRDHTSGTACCRSERTRRMHGAGRGFMCGAAN